MDEISAQSRCSHVAVRMYHHIIVFGGTLRKDEPQLSLHMIWMYNLYTEEWGKHQIPDDHMVPPPTDSACAVVLGKDVFMFGGYVRNTGAATNALWKLSWIPQGTQSLPGALPGALPGIPQRMAQGMAQGIPNGTPQATPQRMPQGCFSWSQIGKYESNLKRPSPRAEHSGWEYAEKLWIFGSEGGNPDGFLSVHGDFTDDANNQLLYFDPTSEEWQNPECFGDIPNPIESHATEVLRNKVWIFGGYEESCKTDDFENLYQLDMNSLIWTNVQTSAPRPLRREYCSLTAATDTQLVLHGGKTVDNRSDMSDTWVYDIPSAPWRTYPKTVKKNYTRCHTGTVGINNNVIIIGGYYNIGRKSRTTTCVVLAPKSLKQLAVQTVHRYKTVLLWEEALPKSLCSLLHVL